MAFFKKITVFLGLMILANCTGDLPLSDLINNTVTLKVLGTYESNDPYPVQHAGAANLNKLPVDDAISNIAALTTPTIATTSDLYKYVTSGVAPYKNLQNNAKLLKYYIDIAEIRLAQGQGKSSSQTISDYWSQFAISRQLMCSDYGTADGRILSNCSDSNGIQRLADFFNGGFTYPAVDVASGSYNHMGIYFRRFATYPAAFFTGDGKFGGGTSTDGLLWDGNGSVSGAESLVPTTFDNRTIYAQDIETLLQNQYNETALEPRMFPVQRKDLSLKITNGAEPYILEVRIFLQNLMMVHMRQITGISGTPSSVSNGAFVYVAPSDWNINHAFLETENNGNSGNSAKQGGAVLMTARAYQSANVGRLIMDATFTPTSHESYFVAVSADSTTDLTTTMPLVATPVTNNVLSNLQPGSYYVYRTCDIKKCDSTSAAGGCSLVAGTDGFPESYAACNNGAAVTVTKGTDSGVTTASCTVAAAGLVGCT